MRLIGLGKATSLHADDCLKHTGVWAKLNSENLKNSVLIANAILAAISLSTLWFTVRRSRLSGQVDALLKVAEWFREPDVVAARKRIYELVRDDHAQWTQADKDSVDVWVAYLDIVATLVITNNISKRDLIRMYGDVLFRTIYVLAPYVSANHTVFGHQYLKSTQIALPSLVKDWKRISTKRWWHRGNGKRYPYVFTLRYGTAPHITSVRINCRTFEDDEALRQITTV